MAGFTICLDDPMHEVHEDGSKVSWVLTRFVCCAHIPTKNSDLELLFLSNVNTCWVGPACTSTGASSASCNDKECIPYL